MPTQLQPTSGPPTRGPLHRARWVVAVALGLALTATTAGVAGTPVSGPDPDAGPHTVVDGAARFQVLSPTLVRVEYAEDGQFEDRPTFNALRREVVPTEVTSTVVDGVREIRTDAVVVRYRQGSGPFTRENLTVELVGRSAPEGVFDNPTPQDQVLGGWLRSLDNIEAPPDELREGVLNRRGWYLLDDTNSAIHHAEGDISPRPERSGAYQDAYLFGYGLDYKQALADLRALTGPTVMLPRKAFGIWYSAWKKYSSLDLQTDVVPSARKNKMPLDVLLVDTDWKLPQPWAGWSWDPASFPDPAGFVDWAEDEAGLELLLNIHPAVPLHDPKMLQAQQAAKNKLQPNFCSLAGPCLTFDWGDPDQVASYFELHDGVHHGDLRWWLDWCCDPSRSSKPGVSQDTWINSLYSKDTSDRGLRPITLSRIGGHFESYGVGGYDEHGPWAEHRYTVHSTHDIPGTFEMLEFASEFTAGLGSTGLPYEAHVVGGFLGTSPPPDDLFVRWTQLGAFQPVLWLHSNWWTNGGERLPWKFSDAARDASLEFLRLRHSLIPYSYALAREAHDTGLPMARPLYLEFPHEEQAYEHDSQYLYGDSVLVAPVATPGTSATTDVWLPPGRWTNWFTGETHEGDRTISVATDWHSMPLFVREGGIVAQQEYMDFDGQKPLDALTLTVGSGGDGDLTLYEDAGDGFGFENGEFARVPVSHRRVDGGSEVTIGAADGDFPGRVRERRYALRFVDAVEPSSVTVDGAPLDRSAWTYDAARRELRVDVASRSTDAPVTVAVRR